MEAEFLAYLPFCDFLSVYRYVNTISENFWYGNYIFGKHNQRLKMLVLINKGKKNLEK